VAPDALALEALATMNARQITALLVCADSTPVGIVHIHDLLREGVA
jgi:arabinose-5-phosphate isomerase